MSMDSFMLAVFDDEPRLRSANADTSTPGRATGAMIAGQHLVVATVEQKLGCTYLFAEEFSFDVQLPDRSQMHVTAFADEVRGWLRNFRMQHLSLRMTPPRGQFTASPFAFKIETVLQMLPWLTLEVVNTQSVSNWLARQNPNLPPPSLDKGVKLARLYSKAIEMAAYAVAHEAGYAEERYDLRA